MRRRADDFEAFMNSLGAADSERRPTGKGRIFTVSAADGSTFAAVDLDHHLDHVQALSEEADLWQRRCRASRDTAAMICGYAVAVTLALIWAVVR